MTMFSPSAEETEKDAFAAMSGDAFRELAREKLFVPANEPVGDFTFNPELRELILAQPMKEAAVLIPIVKRADELTVLLTKRTAALNSHSGQVAFAGGKIDPEDAGRAVNRDVLVPRKAGRFAFGRLIDRQGSLGDALHAGDPVAQPLAVRSGDDDPGPALDASEPGQGADAVADRVDVAAQHG